MNKYEGIVKMERALKQFIGGICIFFLVSPTQAVEISPGSRGTLPLTVSVTVQAVTCDISGSDNKDDITVDFKTITKKGIDNGDYELSVPIKITCSNNTPSLSLQLTGTPANFNKTLLKANEISALGFEFYINDQKWALNSTSPNFTLTSIPVITVKPKLSEYATNLNGGEFTSTSASLILNYE
ncbi:MULTISPECIES: fimbrial protein [Providencia]|uniref:fimbrial protein n=1 Tax=Providencia TaxID=586 RepID=UPI00201D931E|nr:MULTISPECIES: fimbrial protein [Providencia]EMA4784639.1 fimbrial protein [Providencia rettgeri]EMB3084690.1 fimbrial protein [Providencia rettgeri]MDU7496014.1 hypothetical protein [Providencia rettgeri]UQZ14258.1 hypothetical protein M8G38_21520 [Providencia stuartii]HEM8139272.1 fimbrial protein [Providencia rettgeri]